MTLKELQHIAPILAEIQKKGSGFSIPENYFDEIENSISDKLFTDSLSKNSGYKIPENYFDQIENTVLSELAKKTIPSQKIPEGYFDTIEDNVFERLALENKPKVISLKKYWIPATVAATLLVFVSIYNPFTNRQNLEIAEIEQWIEEGNLDLNSYEIAELYTDELENINIKNSINTHDLEEYLNDEISEESFYN
jgi:hypothetical protein